MAVYRGVCSHHVHLFTAVVVFAIFLLAVYIALVTSLNYHRDMVVVSAFHYSASRGNIPTFVRKNFRVDLPNVTVPSENVQLIVHHPGMSSINISSTSECKKKNCIENLSPTDRKRLEYCNNRVKLLVPEASNLSTEGNCVFANQQNRAPTALVSLPGSGNTWVRGLLEKITGICTGAVYCDVSLKSSGFVGENICSGAVLAVKSHQARPTWTDRGQISTKDCAAVYGAVLLMVRNPFHALVADWNRKVANNFQKITINLDSHTTVVGEEWFGGNTVWDEYVRTQTFKWKAIIKNWFLFNRHVPVTVVTYEALKHNTLSELGRILMFMKVNYTQQHLESNIQQGFNMFRRRNDTKMFEHFTCKQQEYIHTVLKDIEALLAKHKKSHRLNITEYYRTPSQCLS